MTAATVDSCDAQTQWAELLQLVLAGNEVLLTQAQKPVMRLVPVANGGKARIAGLHAGMGWMSDDFDDALQGVPAVRSESMTTAKVATSTWQEIRAKKFSLAQLQQLDDGVERELLEMDLRALREAAGLTQEELAQRVAITQSQLSKLERREDYRLSTLRRYVAALGGQLEIVAVVDGKRIHLSQGA